jgi:hypothetical protein
VHVVFSSCEKPGNFSDRIESIWKTVEGLACPVPAKLLDLAA